MFVAIKKYPLLFVFALFTAGFLSFLGHWQYEKGHQREIDDTAKALNFSKQVISLNGLQDKSVLEDGIKVIATGAFDKKIIFHDNRLNLGKSGYHVYSIFNLTDGQSVLVNRGWVKMDFDRRILPEVITSGEQVDIKGIIRYPVKGVYTLGDEQVSQVFPIRVQTIEVNVLSESTSTELQSYSVLLSNSVVGEHFSRQWSDLLPGKYMSADKHYAYSLQWYSLALIALIIFMILIFKMANNEER